MSGTAGIETEQAPKQTTAFAKVYGNGKVVLGAKATPVEEKLVSYALARATRARAYIDLNVFRDLLAHGGVAQDRIAAIASTADIIEDESYYGPRQ